MPHKRIKNKRGKDIPSVTEIIGILDKPFLRYWYGKLGTEECEKIKRESAEYGTSLHEQISLWLKGVVPLTEEYGALAQAFIRSYNRDPVEVEPEEPYVSKKYGYQGTFDWVEKDADGTLVIADLKVTGAMHKEHGLQLAAYANLYNEKHGTDINYGRIYRLDKKTGKLQIKEFPNLEPYWKVFKCLIPVAKWVKEGIT
jgi:hypothetical protein